MYLPEEHVTAGYDIHVVFPSERTAGATALFDSFVEYLTAQNIPHQRPLIFDKPVGPWPTPMWQVLLRPEDAPDDSAKHLGICLGWLMLNRGTFSVMVHPNTTLDGNFGGEYRDHSEYCFWMGEELPLLLDAL